MRILQASVNLPFWEESLDKEAVIKETPFSVRRLRLYR